MISRDINNQIASQTRFAYRPIIIHVIFRFRPRRLLNPKVIYSWSFRSYRYKPRQKLDLCPFFPAELKSENATNESENSRGGFSSECADFRRFVVHLSRDWPTFTIRVLSFFFNHFINKRRLCFFVCAVGTCRMCRLDFWLDLRVFFVIEYVIFCLVCFFYEIYCNIAGNGVVLFVTFGGEISCLYIMDIVGVDSV